MEAGLVMATDKALANHIASNIYDTIAPISRLFIQPDVDTLKFVDEKRGGAEFDTTDGCTVRIVNNFWDYFDVYVTGRDGSTVSITEDDTDNPHALPNAWDIGDRVIEMLLAANGR